MLLRRTGEELRQARVAAGLSLRTAGAAAGISHTQVRRIELALAPHIDIEVLCRLAAVVGHAISISVHPSGVPVRDTAHLNLIARFRSRIHVEFRWRAEVPVPIPGDPRTADGVIELLRFQAIVEAETRLGDVQALERRINAKARDMGIQRVILVVLDSRHNRDVVRSVPELNTRFPVSTRAALAALSRGEDPGGDCLVLL